VWWTWTAPKTGKVVITTDGSPFDTTLDIFTGTLVNDLDHLVFNDDRSPRVYTSLVTFGANQGTTYHIRVDGYYSFGFSPVPWSWVDGGTVNLMLTMDGASKLSPPVLRENNRLSLELTGEPERPYVISNTANFNTWTAVSTNTPVSRRLLIERPVVPGEGRFFRAQPASLVSDE
jgi:hypothetical protein